MLDMPGVSTKEWLGKRGSRPSVAFVLLLLVVSSWGASLSTMPSLAEVGQNWEFDSDGNDIDDALDALVAAGDQGPWAVVIHYDRPTKALDESVLSIQHGVKHMYRYHNWNQDILAYINLTNLDGIADMLDVYGVELLPDVRFDSLVEHSYGTNASAPAVRVREYPLVSDGYNHNNAVFEDLNGTGGGVVIAIIDSGADNTHAALDDMDDDSNTTDDHKVVQKPDGSGGMLYGGMEAIGGDLSASYCIDPDDHEYHGTAVAGIAVGTLAGVAGPGMAPGARMVDIAIRNSPFLGLIGATGLALDFVLDYNNGNSCYGDPGADKIDILSISLGISAGQPNRTIPTQLNDVVRSGITVVMSAGNNAGNGLTNEFEGGIMVANANISLSVDRADDNLQWMSSRGPRQHADGDEDLNDELIPHVTAPGHLVLAPLRNTTVGYFPFRGTSSAAPHIAGIAALMLEANESLRPVDQGSLSGMGDPGAVPIRDILIQHAQNKTTIDIGPPNQPTPFPTNSPLEYDTGMFDLPWNSGWGYGLVDAYAAVLAAQNDQP